MAAYYNENDPFAASWLRNLITAGHIAPGDVDERSVRDVRPEDLNGYSQAHFFAGIGVWSHALRRAGWPDDSPIWTGSCPCQPFSEAGQRKGFADSRHLWPEWFRLIRESRPRAILGEQVASALAWLDLVSGDLESENYAVGAVIVGAHSVGAPHIRQRIYFVADAEYSKRRAECEEHGNAHGRNGPRWSGDAQLVAQSDGGHPGAEGLQRSGEQRQQQADGGARDGLADPSIERRQQISGSSLGDEAADGRTGRHGSKPNGDYLAGGSLETGDLADPAIPRRPRAGQHERGPSPFPARPAEHGGVVLPALEQAGVSGCARESRSSDELGVTCDPRLQRRGLSGATKRRNGSSELTVGAAGLADSRLELPESLGGQNGTPSPERPGRPASASDWSDCDWLPCIDGKARPVEPGTFPLVNGASNRVGRLRGYGNSLVAPLAQAFIEAYMECRQQ